MIPSRTVGYPAWQRAARAGTYYMGPQPIDSMDGRYLCPNEQWVRETPPRDPYCGPVLSGLGSDEPMTPTKAVLTGAIAPLLGAAMGAMVGVIGAVAVSSLRGGHPSPAQFDKTFNLGAVAGGLIGVAVFGAIATRGTYDKALKLCGAPP